MAGIIGRSHVTRRTAQNFHYLTRALKVMEAAKVCPRLRDIDHTRRRVVLTELGRVDDDAALVLLAEHIERKKLSTADAVALVKRARLG